MRVSGPMRSGFATTGNATAVNANLNRGGAASAGDGVRSARQIINRRGSGRVGNPVCQNPIEKMIQKMVKKLIKKILKMLISSLKGVMGGNPASANRTGANQSTDSGATAAKAADGPGGFLWKPVSEGDGNLVVLLPKEMTGDVERVVVRDANGRVIDEGNYSSVANGGREHFRFDKPGAAYGENVTVEVQMKDGTTKAFSIADGADRVD